MRCFIHNNLYFSLNKYAVPGSNQVIFILEAEDDTDETLEQLLNTHVVNTSSVTELFGEDKYSTEYFSKV